MAKLNYLKKFILDFHSAWPSWAELNPAKNKDLFGDKADIGIRREENTHLGDL